MNAKSTVLIVDDESGPRESLKMLLKPLYRVEEADGGRRALQIIRERKIDLVTLDLRMPEMDGATVLKSIKEYDPGIDVMIITGYGSGAHGSAGELLKLGASGYHTKPFDPPRLITEIARTIDHRKKSDRSKAPFPGGFGQSRTKSLRLPLISIYSLTRLRMHPATDILIQDICQHGVGIHSPEMFQVGEFVRVELTFAVNLQETLTEAIVGEVTSTHLLQNGTTYTTRIRFDHLALENPRLFTYIKRLEE